MDRKRLVIVGAGPKAMAIAAKNVVLAELGFEVPEIFIIERTGVAAYWTGTSGFTNGRLPLGTSPEKDVGFPYQSSGWGSDTDRLINERMKRFSWQSFLITSGQYSDWVDSGRPAPEHRQWASYLQWVYDNIKEHVQCKRGEVTRVSVKDGRWSIDFRRINGEIWNTHGDGLMVTGPGKTNLPFPLPVHDRVLTVESFWNRYEQYRDTPHHRIAIVGSGENAASIALALAQYGSEDLQIDIISPQGMTFTRGESYRENRVYSHAGNGNWAELSYEDRKNFISRTDRGVFSQAAQRMLDAARNVSVRPGRLKDLKVNPAGDLTAIREYNGRTHAEIYETVVIATGADQLSLLRCIMTPEALGMVILNSGMETFDQRSVELTIDEALEVKNVSPKLHLPMLSGITQGPGFANLSCLGRLSDHILRPYIQH